MSESAISRVHVVMTRNMDMQSLCRMSNLDLAIDASVKVEKMRAYLLELENRKFIAVFRPRLGGRRAVYRVLKPAERVLES